MKIIKIFTNPLFFLGIILIIGFSVRLYKIDIPVADWHSWRQADTAAVSRNFFKDGFTPFIPKYDNMIGESDNAGPNPNRYRFVEFPIYNSIVYFAYLLNNGVDEKLARLVSIFFSLGSTIFLFLIAKKYWDTFTALVASFTFSVLPFNIYFSRVILPEPSLVFFSLGMFYFTAKWIEEDKRILFLLSIIFAALAFLTKPIAIFYLLPLLYLIFQKEKRIWPISRRYYLWAALAVAPYFAWKIWMSQFPEGIPASGWLLNGNGIRFKPAFWRWILGDRFGREILTVTGSVLFFIGLFIKPILREGILLHLFIASSLLYLIVIATGNVQHDYYQVFIVPALALGFSRGFVLFLRGVNDFIPRIYTIPFVLLFFVLTFYFGWNEVKGLYQVNNGVIVETGKYVDKVLPKNAVVVAPYQGDTAFLYQTNRPGWAMVPLPIKDLIDRYGATYYVSVNYDAKTKWVMGKYTVIEENPKFVIVDLTKENVDFYKHYSPEPM